MDSPSVSGSSSHEALRHRSRGRDAERRNRNNPDCSELGARRLFGKPSPLLLRADDPKKASAPTTDPMRLFGVLPCKRCLLFNGVVVNDPKLSRPELHSRSRAGVVWYLPVRVLSWVVA